MRQCIREEMITSLSDGQITKVEHLLKQDPQELKIAERSLTAISAALGARRRELGKPEPNKYLSTGIETLDTALGGGLLCGGLTEFSGRGASILACRAFEASASSSAIQIVVGGGSGIHRLHCAGRRLVVSSVGEVAECVNAVHRDELAMRTVGGPQMQVMLIDSITRLLDASLGIGGSHSRARIRAETCHIATALRELVVDTNCAVLLVAASATAGIRRIWEQVLDARLHALPVCLEKGCQQEYIRQGDGVYRRTCDHVIAQVNRKNGVSHVLVLNLAASYNRS